MRAKETILMAILVGVLTPAVAHASNRCTERKTAYARSSARKLFRALSANDFQLQPVALKSRVAVAGDGVTKLGAIRFKIAKEADGVVAGAVSEDPAFPDTFVIAMTSKGPIIARQVWPSSAEIDAGAPCKPKTSKIVFPKVSVKNVDMEPFKFWGMRVFWRLPSHLPSSAAKTSAREVLASAVANRQRQHVGVASRDR